MRHNNCQGVLNDEKIKAESLDLNPKPVSKIPGFFEKSPNKYL
jgi:hypothetical protein